MGNESVYTLLADDNVTISVHRNKIKQFKAHLLLNLIFYDKIVLSDNQIISSRNLRRLAREDAIVREFVKAGYFELAVRAGIEDEGEGAQPLVEIQDSFVREGKIDVKYKVYQDKEALDFLESNCEVRTWKYWQVRDSYTKNCKKVLESTFQNFLGDSDFSIFQEILREEEERDQGLGRVFLQKRLPDALNKRLSKKYLSIKDRILECTEAPYITNLPNTLGLNPIYAEMHERSFALFRGIEYELKDLGEPEELPTKLDYEHFIEGVSGLDFVDILELRQTIAVQKFRELTEAGVCNAHDHHELQLAFKEANILIEKKILEKNWRLLQSTALPRRREIQRQVAVSKNGGSIVLDLLAIAVTLPMVGTAYNLLIDAVTKKKFGSEEQMTAQDIALHSLQKEEYENYLRSNGLLSTEDEKSIKDTDSFKVETILR